MLDWQVCVMMKKSIRMSTRLKWLKITMGPNELQWIKRNKRLEIVTRTLNKMMIIQVHMKKMTRVNNMIVVKMQTQMGPLSVIVRRPVKGIEAIT